MGSKHIAVDKARGRVPISGRAIRNDPYANWDFIGRPCVELVYEARLCRRCGVHR